MEKKKTEAQESFEHECNGCFLVFKLFVKLETTCNQGVVVAIIKKNTTPYSMFDARESFFPTDPDLEKTILAWFNRDDVAQLTKPFCREALAQRLSEWIDKNAPKKS